MFTEDGTETVVLARHPEGGEFRVSVDLETQATMINDGWTILVEERPFMRPPTVDPTQSTVEGP